MSVGQCKNQISHASALNRQKAGGQIRGDSPPISSSGADKTIEDQSLTMKLRSLALRFRDEEAVGSNPAAPTTCWNTALPAFCCGFTQHPASPLAGKVTQNGAACTGVYQNPSVSRLPQDRLRYGPHFLSPAGVGDLPLRALPRCRRWRSPSGLVLNHLPQAAMIPSPMPRRCRTEARA